MIVLIGILANITSLILWIPQAILVYRNRDSPDNLNGVSIATQIIVIANTLLWCVDGFLTKNLWLSMGTVIVLPLSIFTISIIIINRKSGKDEDDSNKKIQNTEWITFKMYKNLSMDDKEKFLYSMYTTDLYNQVRKELLNPISYEGMTDLDRMYWSKDLWEETYNIIDK